MNNNFHRLDRIFNKLIHNGKSSVTEVGTLKGQSHERWEACKSFYCKDWGFYYFPRQFYLYFCLPFFSYRFFYNCQFHGASYQLSSSNVYILQFRGFKQFCVKGQFRGFTKKFWFVSFSYEKVTLYVFFVKQSNNFYHFRTTNYWLLHFRVSFYLEYDTHPIFGY